jgi:rod shape determining protein RodA
MLLALVAIAAVYLLDRFWIEDLDLPLARGVAVAALILAAGAGVYYFRYAGLAQLQALLPYLLAGGLAAVYLLDCLTLRFTDALRNPLYVLVLAMLGVILVAGQVAGGSQRWLGAGTVQPSELAKILIIVVLAKFLADNEDRLGRFTTVITSLGIIALPMALIYLQPDLGTALTLLAIWAAMMWMSAIRLRHVVILGGVGLAALPLAWLVMADYMRDRLMLFINPAGDPDSYFNVHQSLVSIGSGGLTGKGLTHGTQSQLHFLRVRHTDFIFAVTAEELGFLGAVLMICLIGILLWRTLRVAEQSRDSFGRLIASGVAAVILFQSSYGGSSYVTLMLGMGLVESVAMRHKKLEFD